MTEAVTHAAAAAGAGATTERHYRIPDGVYCVLDEQNRQWTDVKGAAALAGKSTRTIFHWINRGWVAVRRTPGGHAQVLVSSLWQQEVSA